MVVDQIIEQQSEVAQVEPTDSIDAIKPIDPLNPVIPIDQVSGLEREHLEEPNIDDESRIAKNDSSDAKSIDRLAEPNESVEPIEKSRIGSPMDASSVVLEPTFDHNNGQSNDETVISNEPSDSSNIGQETLKKVNDTNNQKSDDKKPTHNYNLRSRGKIPEINKDVDSDVEPHDKSDDIVLENGADLPTGINPSDEQTKPINGNSDEVADEKAASLIQELFNDSDEPVEETANSANVDMIIEPLVELDEPGSDSKPEPELESDIDFKGLAFPLRSEDRDDELFVGYDDDDEDLNDNSNGCKSNCDNLAPRSRWKNANKNANRNVELEYVANDDYWTFDKLRKTQIYKKYPGSKSSDLELSFRTKHHRNNIATYEKPYRKRLFRRHEFPDGSLSSRRKWIEHNEVGRVNPMNVSSRKQNYIGKRQRLRQLQEEAEQEENSRKLLASKQGHLSAKTKNDTNDIGQMRARSRVRRFISRIKRGIKRVAMGANRRLQTKLTSSLHRQNLHRSNNN